MSTCANGHIVPEGMRFCGECGAAVEALPAATPPSPRTRPTLARMPLPAVAVALLLIVAWIAFRATSSSQTITGVFHLKDNASTLTCSSAEGGYDDIGDGTQVTVTNEGGEVIGTSVLTNSASVGGGCVYDFEVKVKDAQFFSIEVSHRGKVTYSKDDLIDRDWGVILTLG